MAASMADILNMIRGTARRDKNPGLLRRSRDLAVSLYFLAQDWKPCLLFDFCAASDETLLAFRKAAAVAFVLLGILFILAPVVTRLITFQ
jgi:hypothetical protein